MAIMEDLKRLIYIPHTLSSILQYSLSAPASLEIGRWGDELYVCTQPVDDKNAHDLSIRDVSTAHIMLFGV